MAKRNTTDVTKRIIEPTERISIMWKNIKKDRKEYDFYDIRYGDVIITGCKVVESKRGDFLGMPSQERNGEYYPLVYMSHELNDKLVEYIQDADEHDDWKEMDDNENLSFDTDTGRSTRR